MLRCLLVVLFACSASSISLTVPGLGLITGTETETAWTYRNVHAFYGIRFALSPSGNRRFMPPEPVEAWDGEYDATAIGRQCPQLLQLKHGMFSDPKEDVEDCLFLNVFTPKDPNEWELLPVMVYIHGGAFYEGRTSDFPPDYILEKDVILVVIQYRLGPLGFMTLHIDGLAGNVGFMDQVMALQWVNKNIKSFGGDNRRVTVFGQSAGAGSISLLLMSPLVNNSLFQSAILHSGTGLSNWIIDNDPLVLSKNLFKELTNITGDVEATVMEDYFKNCTVNELFTAVLQLLIKDPFTRIARAVIQKAGKVKFLENHPAEIVKFGNFLTVPMMTGVAKNDGSFLVTAMYDGLEQLNLLNDSDYLKTNFTNNVLEILEVDDETWTLTNLLENKYFSDLFSSNETLTFRDVAPGIIDVSGILYFKSPLLRQAKVNANYQPTYVYTFDYKGEHTRFGYGKDTSKYPFEGGVHHSDDLLYLYPYPYTTPLNDEDTKIAKLMVDLWTSFAMDNKPNSTDKEEWLPLIKGTNGPYYHINSTSYLDDDFVANEFKTYD